MARNILTYANVHHYCNCLPFIDSIYFKNEIVPVGNSRLDNDILKISAEPNPAHTYVAFNFELQHDYSTGMINISDVHGNTIWKMQVIGKIGQEVWNSTGIRPGVYYYNLMSESLSKTGKIVIY